MVLNMPEQSIQWKYIDKTQSYTEMPTGHIAVDCFEFPDSGWKNPHESEAKPLGNLHPANAGIKRSAFEIQPGDLPNNDARGSPALASCSPQVVVQDEELLAPEDIYYGPQSFMPKQTLCLDWPLDDFEPSCTSFDAARMLSGDSRHGSRLIDGTTCKPYPPGGLDRPTAFDHLFWGEECSYDTSLDGGALLASADSPHTAVHELHAVPQCDKPDIPSGNDQSGSGIGQRRLREDRGGSGLPKAKEAERRRTNRGEFSPSKTRSTWSGSSCRRARERQDKKKHTHDPILCQHPSDMMRARGGRNNLQWWNCQACGTRWDRIPLSKFESNIGLPTERGRTR